MSDADQVKMDTAEAALSILVELCGISESKARGTRPDQANNVVLYVRRTCVLRKPHKLVSRIIRYRKYRNSKRDLINEAFI